MEKWKLTDYKDIEVSSLCRVRRGSFIFTQSINNGAYMVAVKEGGKTLNLTPHRLAAKAFIPNPNNYPDVIHIDGNRLNNSLNNLKWGKRERKGNSTSGENHGRALLTIADVKEVREKRKKGYSFAELAQDYGVSVGCIQGAVTKNWKNVE